ncbi:hypothetical protein PRIPAC_89583 [Pristionchus pacificus]|uniref:Uncharacterized protein n=1 Tax=Pristionchus pacificus TaxID=54126 RepID=A0A2A6B908_PRIPA|nr:hypothetical protein PRIPAC_89583 [Pristionchus pacificus]|eukprot:PDM62356.1 hypothetical protein PRIPAC_51798 [Pristionchus pacificus]
MVSERGKKMIADVQFPNRREKSVGKCWQCFNKQVLIMALISLSLESRNGDKARVTFNHSVILDEFDFRAQSSVSIIGLCSDTCHIYASITPESRKLSDNILIQTGKVQSISFFILSSLADLHDTSNNRKLFLEVNNTPTLSIVNGNSGNIAGPLVLYLVNKAGAYFSSAEVYEAEGLDRPPSQVQAITILSARPFTLTESSFAPMGVLARLTGFDALGYMTDDCPNLYYLIRGPFPGFIMTINAPVVSLLYDVQQFHQYPTGELKTTMGISTTHQMQLSGFIYSPGYHGCPGKPAYQSSLNDMTTQVVELVQDPINQDIQFNVLTNSDEAHALTVANSAGAEFTRYFDTGDVTPHTGGAHDKNLQRALNTLECDKNITMKKDTHRSASSHQMVYGLADAIHLFIKAVMLSKEVNEERNEEFLAEEMVMPKEEIEEPFAEEMMEMVAPKEEGYMDDKEFISVQPVTSSFLPPPPAFEQETSLKLFSSTSHVAKSESPAETAFDLGSYHEPSSMEAVSWQAHLMILIQMILNRQFDLFDDLRIVLSQDSVLVCPICQHISTKATGLQSHLRRIHDGITMNELGIGLLCECGKMFNAFYACFKHNQKGCTGSVTMFSRTTGETNEDIS